MIRFAGRGILLDIEGTTSSVRFVYDVLFPYARRELIVFLRFHWDDPAVKAIREATAKLAGHADFQTWTGGFGTPPELQHDIFRTEIIRLMDADSKATPLKELQGLIWRQGFENGDLHAHVYPDVVTALRQWQQAGKDVRIYSSGSIEAQKLYFAHVDTDVTGDLEKDLTGYFRGHYDTTIGAKREVESYRRIAADMGLAASELLFLSDVPAELDAARAAGLATGLVQRPENAPLTEEPRHACVRSFAEIELV